MICCSGVLAGQSVHDNMGTALLSLRVMRQAIHRCRLTQERIMWAARLADRLNAALHEDESLRGRNAASRPPFLHSRGSLASFPRILVSVSQSQAVGWLNQGFTDGTRLALSRVAAKRRL